MCPDQNCSLCSQKYIIGFHEEVQYSDFLGLAPFYFLHFLCIVKSDQENICYRGSRIEPKKAQVFPQKRHHVMNLSWVLDSVLFFTL